jgi:hypothetical protein
MTALVIASKKQIAALKKDKRWVPLDKAKGLRGKKFSAAVIARVAKMPNTKTPLTLNQIPGMPHNVIFTRDKTPTCVEIWGTQTQLHLLGEVWMPVDREVLPIDSMSIQDFKRLFFFTLPKGKAVNGRISLCGGLRTK